MSVWYLAAAVFLTALWAVAAELVALPIMLLFIKIQKFYVGGVVGGAVKG